MKQSASFDVRPSRQLPEVPLATCLPGRRASVNVRTPSGKWPQKMIGNAQRLRTTLAARCPRARAARGTGEQREEDVVLERLPRGLAQDRAAPARGRPAHFAREDPIEPEVVQRDAPLEDDRQQRRVERLPRVRAPRLLLGHAEEAVADVAILAEHVGERVVLEVVRVPPVVAGAGVVPFEGRRPARGRSSSRTGRASRCDRSPCSRGSSRRPARGTPPSEAGGIRPKWSKPRRRPRTPAAADHRADIIGVPLAEVAVDELADRVELAPESLGLLTA